MAGVFCIRRLRLLLQQRQRAPRSAISATAPPTAIPAIAPLDSEEAAGVAVGDTCRVGVRTGAVYFRDIRILRSGSVNPLSGAVLVAAPFALPPITSDIMDGTT